MSGEVIQFPRSPREQVATRIPAPIFQITEDGIVDLAEGVTVTDAVTTFWEAVSETVREAWADSPLAAERARVRLLTAYLDRVRPGWRSELPWQF